MIKMIKETYERENTSEKWQLVKETTEQITQEFYHNIVDYPWKGDRRYKAYTVAGYKVVKVISTEQTYKLDRTIYRFKLEG